MNYRTYSDFKKGVIHTDAIGIGKEASGTLREGKNIRVRSGSIAARPGRSVFSDLSGGALAGATIQTIHEFQREAFDGSDFIIWSSIIFTANNRMYYIVPDDSTTVFVEIDNTFTLASMDIYGVSVFDHFFFGNAQDPLKMTNAVYVANVGIEPPGTDPTNVNAGGTLTGFKKYKYTFYDGTIPYPRESNASDELEVEFIATQKTTITMDAGDADDSVTRFRLYATEIYADPLAPETDFFLISEQVLGTTTYEDDAATATSTPYDTTDRGVPPVGHKLLWHDSRLFVVGESDNPSIIFYSETGRPWYFPANNWDEISRDDGDFITALGSIGRTRYIFKERSIYEWTGDPESVTPITAVERPGATMNMNRVAVGCKDPKSLVSHGSSLLFRAHDGHVYQITPNNLVKLSEFYLDVLDLADDSIAAELDDYYIISSGGVTHVCDLRTGAWQGNDTIMTPNSLLVYHTDILLGAEGDEMKQYYTGTQDEGEDFEKSFKLPFKGITSGEQSARIRRWVIEDSLRTADVTVTSFNEKEQIDSGTYANGTRHYSLPASTRGKVADYLSGKFAWTTGSLVVEGVRAFFLKTLRRH